MNPIMNGMSPEQMQANLNMMNPETQSPIPNKIFIFIF